MVRRETAVAHQRAASGRREPGGMSLASFVVRLRPGEPFAVLTDSLRTGGTLGVVACTWSPGSEPPPHTLPGADRAFLVTAGACRLRVGDEEYDAWPDDLVFVPRGHRLTVTALEETRATVVVTPAGAEAWLAAVAVPDRDAATALGIALDHGVQVHLR